LQITIKVLVQFSERESATTETCLDGGRVHFKLAEDCESFFVQLAADSNVGDVRRVVVVQSVDVLHHSRPVGLDRRQDQQVLQIPDDTQQLSMPQTAAHPATSCHISWQRENPVSVSLSYSYCTSLTLFPTPASLLAHLDVCR